MRRVKDKKFLYNVEVFYTPHSFVITGSMPKYFFLLKHTSLEKYILLLSHSHAIFDIIADWIEARVKNNTNTEILEYPVHGYGFWSLSKTIFSSGIPDQSLKLESFSLLNKGLKKIDDKDFFRETNVSGIPGNQVLIDEYTFWNLFQLTISGEEIGEKVVYQKTA